MTGGVWVHIEKRATPLVNTAVLLVGSVLSNLVGTTGASVLLIRSYLRINRGRVRGYHIVFFIFVVGNVSGLLTPVGGTPPFFWPLKSLWPIWGTSVAILLTLFYFIDRKRRSATRPRKRRERRSGSRGGSTFYSWG